jgi:hypothetical protein
MVADLMSSQNLDTFELVPSRFNGNLHTLFSLVIATYKT